MEAQLMSVNPSQEEKASRSVYTSLISNSHLLLSSSKKLWGKKLMEMNDHYHLQLRFYAIMFEILPSLFLQAVCTPLWNKTKYGVPMLLQKDSLQNCLKPISYVSLPAARISTHIVNLPGSLISFGCLNRFEAVSSKQKICYCILYASVIMMFL